MTYVTNLSLEEHFNHGIDQTPSQSLIKAHSSEGKNKEDNSFEKYEVADKQTVVASEILILMCLYPRLAQRV